MVHYPSTVVLADGQPRWVPLQKGALSRSNSGSRGREAQRMSLRQWLGGVAGTALRPRASPSPSSSRSPVSLSTSLPTRTFSWGSPETSVSEGPCAEEGQEQPFPFSEEKRPDPLHEEEGPAGDGCVGVGLGLVLEEAKAADDDSQRDAGVSSCSSRVRPKLTPINLEDLIQEDMSLGEPEAWFSPVSHMRSPFPSRRPSEVWRQGEGLSTPASREQQRAAGGPGAQEDEEEESVWWYSPRSALTLTPKGRITPMEGRGQGGRPPGEGEGWIEEYWMAGE